MNSNIASYKNSKFIKEALHYIKLPDSVRCLLCPNQCVLRPGDKSLCHTRVNIDNTLYTIAYGNPCALNTDPIEKKPLFHFLPGSRVYSIATAGCNLCCLNCQNWDISQASPDEIRNYDMMPEQVVEDALKNNTKIIAYTYTDPIAFYEYAFDTSQLARTKCIKNVLVTNGYINEKPLREIAKFTDAANVDLKSFSDDTYMRLNAGKLKPVLNTLKILKEKNVWIEITNLIVPEWTDNLDMIKEMCDWLYNNGFQDYPLHFSKFHPTYKLNRLTETPLNTIEKAKNIATNSGIKYVYVGNVSSHPAENTFCHNCKKPIIERHGFTIMNNYIENDSCKFCGTKIPGVWN